MRKGLPEHLLYKNHLQEYAQRSGLQLPVYESSSEGFPHAPRFRASVRVNQTTYTSKLTFPHRKEAEQNVAKIALEIIKEESSTKDKPSFSTTTIYEDPKCCKSILNEYAFRTNHTSPKYTTIQQDKSHPVYVSSLVFDGKTYTGEVGGSKKEAEQLVARITIESLLGSDSGILHQIINSKNKTYGGRNIINDNSINQSNIKRSVPQGPSQQPVNVLSSFADLHSVGPSANANQKTKRKLEHENGKQKEMPIHKQVNHSKRCSPL
ncbi:hypothetical protein DITRI_Ditri04bG0201700 [Diplodiscus trichospermus]